MSNLLSAEFTRLFKSKFFYIMSAVCVTIPFIIVLGIRHSMKNIRFGMSSVFYNDFELNEILFFVYGGFVISIFISLFVSREFSDGTVRNKLTVGHSRLAVYISEFVVCFSASLIMQVIYIVSLVSMYSIFIDNGFDNAYQISSVKEIVQIQLLGVCITSVYVAISLLISILIEAPSKAVTASMVIALVLLIFGQSVYSRLLPDEAFDDLDNATYDLFDDYLFEEYLLPEDEWDTYSEEYNRIFTEKIEELRGKDLSNAKRNVYLVFNDFLPSCQAEDMFQYAFVSLPVRTARYVLCDCSIVIIITALGIFLFNRKGVN